MDLITSIKLSQSQLLLLAGVLVVVAAFLIWFVAKEIYYAVNPDKRPTKRKLRK